MARAVGVAGVNGYVGVLGETGLLGWVLIGDGGKGDIQGERGEPGEGGGAIEAKDGV